MFVKIFFNRVTWFHQFTSLATSPLTGTKRGTSTWSPTVAGVEFKPLDGAPTPAANAVQRLAQMRSLAGEFTASDLFENRGRFELRLMPKPLYRYASLKRGITDGAFFGFALGTVPEVGLLLEAHADWRCFGRPPTPSRPARTPSCLSELRATALGLRRPVYPMTFPARLSLVG